MTLLLLVPYDCSPAIFSAMLSDQIMPKSYQYLCMNGTLLGSNWWLLGALWRKQSAGKHMGGSQSQYYVFCQNTLSTLGPWAADTLRLCMVVYFSAPHLPSSTQSPRPWGIYKINIRVQRREISRCFPFPKVRNLRWFGLNSKWKQCCFFPFMQPPSGRTACQTTFL